MPDFTFATAQYDSGDWDSAPMVPANIIDSVARYTGIDVAPVGAIVPLGSRDLFKYPLVHLTGHLPVRFSDAERATLKEVCARGGLLFIDDHNHDVDGQFHRTAWEEVARAVGPLKDLPNDHALFKAFFPFPDGPPTTSHELNGWGDNLVHKHLQAVLEVLGIPYALSGPGASALAMDKGLTKRLMRSADIPTPDWLQVTWNCTGGTPQVTIPGSAAGPEPDLTLERIHERVLAEIGFPAVVKLNAGGSSVGVEIVGKSAEFPAAFERVATAGGSCVVDVLIEKFIPGRELTSAIMLGRRLPLLEIRPRTGPAEKLVYEMIGRQRGAG